MKAAVIGIISTLATMVFGQFEATSPNPGLKNRQYQEELADAYERIDPTKDGWESEARSSEYQIVLENFLDSLLHQRETKHITPNFKSAQLLKPQTNVVFKNAGLIVRRIFKDTVKIPYSEITSRTEPGFKTKIKMISVTSKTSESLVTLKSSLHQINAHWSCAWTETSPPKLETITLKEFEEVKQTGPYQLLTDVTASAFNQNPSYQSQLLRSTDHWRSRIPRDFGLDSAANHGLAIADVNGDGLEDLYLCQQGGLPNLLFLQNLDGTLTDFSVESKTNWLDYCAAALFLDFDNDGDQDLVISQDFKILFMDNIDGKGHFELAFGRSTKAQSFSLTSADFDQDGFVDVYVCGYNPSASSARAGALAEPVPFHDANNGGENILWRNNGDWTFQDVTKQTGLNQNNTRFSFAASWEDYDQDGDLDLYLANDFGRNCLYQNQGAKLESSLSSSILLDLLVSKTLPQACRPTGVTLIGTVGWTSMFLICFQVLVAELRDKIASLRNLNIKRIPPAPSDGWLAETPSSPPMEKVVLRISRFKQKPTWHAGAGDLPSQISITTDGSISLVQTALSPPKTPPICEVFTGDRSCRNLLPVPRVKT
jgi:hypothetical protein